MAPGGRRAPRMAPDERRAAIVAASLPLVLRHGAAVTTRQIAEAAGIAEGTIFRAFPDKDSVIRAVLAEALDQTASLRELAAIDPALPLRARLTAAVVVLQRRVSDVFGLLGALGWLRQPPDPPPHEDPRRTHPSGDPAEIERAFRAAVVALVGTDAPQLRVPPEEFAHVMRLLVFSGTHPLISGGRTLSAEEIVTTLLDGLLRHRAPTTGGAADPTTPEDLAC